ncbi:MAG: Uncharacterised protein [Prochlorococcus marinus str. MIT 9215]|nr:MAG: Uncharacterised protein [Prochlorococcus marinus str. MIT 9215]
MKRLDLIVSERELDSVIKALDKANAPGYSVIKHVTGRGPDTSVSEGMDFSGLGANAHVIVFCEQDVVDKLRELVNPILDYYGGVAYVAEAHPM